MRSLTGRLAASCLISFFLIAGSPARASDTLYSIGADAFGVGRNLTPVQPAGAVTALGDGSVAFNGGLAYLPAAGKLYAIENDAFGQSSLTSLVPAVSLTDLAVPVALGSGFYGGLAADTANATLYALASDPIGNSTLYSVGGTGATALGAIGTGFYGGLTYDAADDSLYAIGSDDSFVQRRLFRINLAGGTPTATVLFDLGDGGVAFNGGLTFDASSGNFLAIGSDSFANSSLYSFTLAGAASLGDLGSVGVGFMNAGLAFAPAGAPVTPVPEPHVGWLVALGLPPIWLATRRRASLCAPRFLSFQNRRRDTR